MDHDRRSAIRAFLVPWLSAVLLGCAAAPPSRADMIERISFQPDGAPFCGRCETTAFTVAADGETRIEKGRWAGRYRDWRTERSVKRVTIEQFAEFRRRLAAYRPALDILQGDAGCREYLHDQGGVIVEWSNGDVVRRRVFDFGCLDDRTMNDVVSGAPHVLGL